jgi:hypothetical protein
MNHGESVVKQIVAYRMPEMKSWKQLDRVFAKFQIVLSTYVEDHIIGYHPAYVDDEGIEWPPEPIDDDSVPWWDQTEIAVSDYIYTYANAFNRQTGETSPYMSHITLQILLKDEAQAEALIRELRFCGFVGSVDPDYQDRSHTSHCEGAYRLNAVAAHHSVIRFVAAKATSLEARWYVLVSTPSH